MIPGVTETGVNVQRSILGAGAGVLLFAIPAFAATPDELYQTWQQDNLRRPEMAENAAQDYLHAMPAGPHAHELQIWLDAYHQAMASLLSGASRRVAQGTPAAKLASAQPTPRKQPGAQSGLRAAPRPVMPPAPPPQLATSQSGSLSAPLAASQPAAPTAQPAPQPTPVLPSQPAARPAPPTVQPPETRLASATPPENNVQKKQPLNAPENKAPVTKLEGQSLAQALAFIADKVDGEGKISVLAQFPDATADRDLVKQLSYEASDATIDPNRCRVSFQWHLRQDGTETADRNRTIELRLIRNIKVETVDQALTDLNAAAGHPFPVHAQPEVYVVHIDRWDRPSGDDLYFRDKDMAVRVGAAAQHALDLCDDGPGQAFRHG
jgi:hypothetical protein